MPIELKDGEAVEMGRTLLNFHRPLGEAVVGGIWQEMLDRMRDLNGFMKASEREVVHHGR
jgi:hypothetical protein